MENINVNLMTLMFDQLIVHPWDTVSLGQEIGSISAVSRVRSLILPEKRRLDAWPVDLVCDVIEKLII